MISVIITAYKEPKTVGKAIERVLANNLTDYEIIVSAPDEKTLEVARNYPVRLVKDNGEGKPAALNLAVSEARGDILVLTDGDVFIEKDSLNCLLDHFKNKKIGAVSGNPRSLNARDNMLGYWAYVLTEVANKRRKKAIELKKRFFCSGYLFAIRKELFPDLPEELLSEDGFISHNVYSRGYLIDYAEKAEVYVKYPTNFYDWIIQKKRSAGGYNQINNLIGVEIRSFSKESRGFLDPLRYFNSFKEFYWTAMLYFSRIYLWAVIYRDINLNKKSHKEIWKRVESTK